MSPILCFPSPNNALINFLAFGKLWFLVNFKHGIPPSQACKVSLPFLFCIVCWFEVAREWGASSSYVFETSESEKQVQKKNLANRNMIQTFAVFHFQIHSRIWHSFSNRGMFFFEFTLWFSVSRAWEWIKAVVYFAWRRLGSLWSLDPLPSNILLKLFRSWCFASFHARGIFFVWPAGVAIPPHKTAF